MNAGFATNQKTSYGAQVGVGAVSGPFAAASLSRDVFDVPVAPATGHTSDTHARNGVGAGVGYGFDLTPAKAAQFCPYASYGYHRGPSFETAFGTVRNTTNEYGLAGSVGAIAASFGAMDFVPFAGLEYIHERIAVSGAATGTHFLEAKNLDFGAGFVFNHRMTVRPSAAVGIGAGNLGHAYAVAFGMNFGAVSATK